MTHGRSEDGVAFIRERVHALRRQLKRNGGDPDTRFLLGEYESLACVIVCYQNVAIGASDRNQAESGKFNFASSPAMHKMRICELEPGVLFLW